VRVVVIMSDDREAAWPGVEVILDTDFEKDPIGWLDHAVRGHPFLIRRKGGRPFAVMIAVTVHPDGLAGLE
jgi:hypothetical protein